MDGPTHPDDDMLAALDAQCHDYQAMYREGLHQRDCLRDDDPAGLNAATERIRGLMDRVRLRQSRLPADLAALEGRLPGVAERTAALRQIIRAVLEVRDQSEQAAHQQLAATRRQLHQFDTGRRASRRYQPVAVREARFVDGTR